MSRRRIVRRLLGAAGLVVLAGWIASLAGVLIAAERDEARPVSAIVVLGAAQYDGRPSPVLRARLDHAITLWNRGLAPRLVLTGGFGQGDTTSEAAVGRRYAIKRGVPDSAIRLETQGRTTSESMRAVARLVPRRPPADMPPAVLLVSDPFHSFRLRILARRYGLRPYTSPTRTSPISDNPSEFWKYLLGESLKAPYAYLFERRDP